MQEIVRTILKYAIMIAGAHTMVAKQEIIEFLQTNKAYLQKTFGVKTIGIFGSIAREEANEKSDIDIIVDMPPSFDKLFALKNFLEKNFGQKVDIVRVRKKMNKYLKHRIHKEGILV